MDDGLTTGQLIEMLHQKVREMGTQDKLAESLGISPQHLSDVLRGKRDISQAIAHRLGLWRAFRFYRTWEG